MRIRVRVRVRDRVRDRVSDRVSDKDKDGDRYSEMRISIGIGLLPKQFWVRVFNHKQALRQSNRSMQTKGRDR